MAQRAQMTPEKWENPKFQMCGGLGQVVAPGVKREGARCFWKTEETVPRPGQLESMGRLPERGQSMKGRWEEKHPLSISPAPYPLRVKPHSLSQSLPTSPTQTPSPFNHI